MVESLASSSSSLPSSKNDKNNNTSTNTTTSTTNDENDNNNTIKSPKNKRTTDYSSWNTKTKILLQQTIASEDEERIESSKALGLDGKYSYSKDEEIEKEKLVERSKHSKELEGYNKRELDVIQIISDCLVDGKVEEEVKEDVEELELDESKKIVSPSRYITRLDMEEGRRVLTVCDTSGPGTIILPEDLSLLENNIPSNLIGGMTPKSYPNDAENDVVVVDDNTKTNDSNDKSSSTAAATATKTTMVKGLIKLNLSNLSNLTVVIRCKVLTGTIEITHCQNVTVRIEGRSCILPTIQIDLSHQLTLELCDAGGSGCSSGSGNSNTIGRWGESTTDRIVHAGVSNMVVTIQSKANNNGRILSKCQMDYLKDGALSIGNATAKEVQFVTRMVNGSFVTERAARNSTGTAVGGSSSSGNGNGSSGGSGVVLSESENRMAQERQDLTRKAIEKTLMSNNTVKILDKDGNEVSPSAVFSDTDDDDDKINQDSNNSISSILNECEEHKKKGNEAFMTGNYTQAILMYTLALDAASSLPDATTFNNNKNTNQDHQQSSTPTSLFPRHVILSNRSASFLKMGQHEKALEDATKACDYDSTYIKAHFRKGLAMHALGRYQDAIMSLATAHDIEPKNKQIKQALQFAEVRMEKERRRVL